TRLYFAVIPRMVDDYETFLAKYPEQEQKQQLANPVWHIHSGNPPEAEQIGGGASLSFSMLLNLVAVANSEDQLVLWGFIRRYAPEASPQTHPRLDELVGYAGRYYRDFVRPAKTYRAPDDAERAALQDLHDALGEKLGSTDAEDLQAIVYEVGRTHFPDTSGKSKSPDGRPGVSKIWFETIYQILLGEQRGPRFGSFVALYGVEETRELIAKALAGALIAEHQAFLESRSA
ncbi:MAG TPA: lysine--tRNA ligase, partial [Saliniramus sp.]|nr:lysine--tRNA ligase [Saliniramus sp.]